MITRDRRRGLFPLNQSHSTTAHEYLINLRQNASANSAVPCAKHQTSPFSLRSLVGIDVTVSSRSDWALFAEIFADGEYDEAIDLALSSFERNPSEAFHFLDLGANVGYFSLKLLHEIRGKHPDLRVHGNLVEASPPTFHMLKQRLQRHLQSNEVECRWGAVGKLNGLAFIDSFENAAGAPLDQHHTAFGKAVSYLDLNTLVESVERIDLLKCDIEGSEEDFCENYPQILARARVLVVEVHPSLCNTRRVEEIIENSGLRKHSRRGHREIDAYVMLYQR